MVAPSGTFSDPVQKALTEAKKELSGLYGDRLRKLIVYGSQARGDTQPESDVDLMVILKGSVDPAEEANRTSGLVIRLAGKHGVLLSPLHMSENEFRQDRPLPRNARKEGIVI